MQFITQVLPVKNDVEVQVESQLARPLELDLDTLAQVGGGFSPNSTWATADSPNSTW
jgi:hypothetical protein